MKRIPALLLTLALSTAAFAQSSDPVNEKKALFEWGDHKINGYLGTAIRGSKIFNDACAYVDLKGALTMDESWGIGLMGSGLYYDKRLRSLTQDGSYHLYVSYGAIFVEKYFSLASDLKLSLGIASGMGEAYYRYDRDYRASKPWYQETIDKTDFHFVEPSIGLDYRVSRTLWLGLTGSYRSTSPVELTGTADTFMRKFTGGISLKWGAF